MTTEERIRSIGENVRRARQEVEMTQGELSILVGCTRTQIVNVEAGAAPSLRLFLELGDALDLTTCDLIRGN